MTKKDFDLIAAELSGRMNLSTLTLKQVAFRVASTPGLPPPPPFIETRWPFTYAYDYVRTHPRTFGVAPDPELGRADVAALLRDNPKRREICELLATQYCVDNGITIPAKYKEASGKLLEAT